MNDQLFEQIFQLKFTVKQLERSSKKAEKEAEKKKKMVLQSVQKGNLDAARIHGSDVIRKKNEALNLLKLAAKVDGVRSRLETLQANKQIATAIGNLTKQLSAAEVLDVQRVSHVMEQFERKFEDMEVATDVLEKSMGSVTANMSDQQEVDGLIRQVADEYSLELNVLLPQIGQRAVSSPAIPAAESPLSSGKQSSRSIAN